MKKAYVVIGANFGDEGKGLITDYLSARMGSETLVVRFNGGAQAGHTVTHPDGRRHVFGHIGSGSFSGCRTFLSRFFVCNPLTFLKERETLRRLGVTPTIYIDPHAPVTTPYDMMINQYAEESRGVKRHGSCGLGFGETLERGLHPHFALTFADLAEEKLLRTRLTQIRDYWVPERLRILGLDGARAPWDHFLTSPQILENFLVDVRRFLAQVHYAHPDLLANSRSIVFEGAQGLLLDQDYGWFPHVTRSNTGLKNVVALAEEAGIAELKTYYLTRSYLTRHGAGPMPNESATPLYAKIHDPTNIPNDYQGRLRFGALDLDVLSKAIMHDLKYVPSSIKHSYGVSVSCMDQIDGDALCVSGGELHRSSPAAFLARVESETEAARLLVSHGPTREDVFAWRKSPVSFQAPSSLALAE